MYQVNDTVISFAIIGYYSVLFFVVIVLPFLISMAYNNHREKQRAEMARRKREARRALRRQYNQNSH